VKVAAYQAPYLRFGSMDAIGLVRERIDECEAMGVEILCCPESVIGGLAHESDGESPSDVALRVDNGEFAEAVASLLDTTVTVIVGFTERDSPGRLFSSAAVLQGGSVAGLYRKVYPGYRTTINAGDQLQLFRHAATAFGIIICNDIWYVEPARVLAAAGAALLLVPTNSGHLRMPSRTLRARGQNLAIARAVENSTTVVVADVAGQQAGRVSCGLSSIIDPDGVTLASAQASAEGLVVAEVEPQRRQSRDPRGGTDIRTLQ